MTYALAESLIPDGKPVLDGMCLADWEAVEGFDWGDLAASEQIILPAAIRARAAGSLRQVRIERPGDSPNQGGFGQLVPSPCREVVLHWWGTPVGQSHDGVVEWLRNRASYVSAHLVLSPGRATQILPWTSPSWANGHTWMNANSITLECDPNDITGTIATVIEVLVDLIGRGVVHPDFRLTGHRDHYATECPGTYYPRLGSIRARATTTGGTAMATVEQIWAKTVKRDGGRVPVIQEVADTKTIARRVEAQLAPVKRGGKLIPLRQEIADTKTLALSIQAQLGALTAAVETLAQTQGADPARIEAILQDAVAEALDGLTVTGTVTIEGEQA